MVKKFEILIRRFKVMRSVKKWMTTCVVLMSIVSLVAALWVATEFGVLGAFITLLGLVIFFGLQGLYIVPADPPVVIVITIFGEPTNIVLRAGWRWLPLKGLVFGALEIEILMVNEDIEDVEYFTKDNIRGKAPVSWSWVPISDAGAEAEAPDGSTVHPLLNYVTAGKKDGVNNIMKDKVIGTFVEFMKTVPTWSEGLAVGDRAVSAILRAITGEDPIPSNVATRVLFKYFSLDRAEYDDEDRRLLKVDKDATKDQVVQAIETKITEDDAGDLGEFLRQENPGESYRNQLRAAIRARYEQIAKLRVGRARHDLSELGIRVTRVNIGERAPDDAVMKAAAQIVTEGLQAVSEGIQSNARREQAMQLAFPKVKDENGNLVEVESGMSLKEATQLQLVETGKLPNYYAVSIDANEQARDLVSKVAEAVPGIAAVLAATKGKQGQSKGGKK
jgi:hypothetical protein